MAFKDYRRTDLNTTVLPDAHWISSKIISAVAVAGIPVVSFSFNDLGLYTNVQAAILQITTAFQDAGSPTISVGRGTLPTDTTSEFGTMTVIDAEEFIASADITPKILGYYPALSSSAVALWSIGLLSDPLIGAVNTTPVVYALVTTGTLITNGYFRVFLQVSSLPGTRS